MDTEQLQAKKKNILEYTKTGLSFSQACLLANLPAEQTAELQKDESFQYCVRQQKAMLEFSMLEQIVAVARNSTRTGMTTDARWLLEKLNPEDWGKQQAAGGFVGFVIPDEYDGL